MSAEETVRAYEIFHEALGRSDPTRFLEEACEGEPGLRAEVEALLDAEPHAAGFLATAPAAPAGAPIAPGDRISHYAIVAPVGHGGMGEVFLARDLALGRPAAIKVLPERFTPWQCAGLLGEARMTARLQHPAIATFYEAGEVDGISFIAMELVPGRTLRRRLAEGPLPPAEVWGIGSCLLEALAHAHAAGLLHRDLKPENIMVTGTGSAKLLDFGIAKEIEPYPAGPVEVAGTAGYMSPEQLQGAGLDGRSDLFALGAVLYECLTGRLAFPGETFEERRDRILAGPMPRLHPGEIPEGSGPVLARALARDREDRYPSAAAFLADIRRMCPCPAVASLPATLAILELEDRAGDPDSGWIGSGLAEGVSSELAGTTGLEVFPPEAVLAARRQLLRAGGRVPTSLETGLALPCRWILEGGFERSHDALSLTARLVEVPTGEILAIETFEGTVERILEIQDRLAGLVLATLDLPRPATKRRPRIEAYECHARGRRIFHEARKGSLELSANLFLKAIELDPAHPGARVGLAAVHCMHFPSATDPGELETAAEHARRAIREAPDLGEAHVWLGYALWRLGNDVEGQRLLRRSLELDPRGVFPGYFAGAQMEALHRHREALEICQECARNHPGFGWIWLALGWSHLSLGDFAEAVWCLQRAADLERAGQSATPGVEGYLAECLRRAGDLDGARDRALAGLESNEKSDNWYRDTFRGICLGVLGRTALARGDREAARAAFTQAVLLHRGRPRALGCGHLLVQSLAGLTRAGGGPEPLEEALEIFRARRCYSFHWLWACSDDRSLLEMARAARTLGRPGQARDLLGEARAAAAPAPGADRH